MFWREPFRASPNAPNEPTKPSPPRSRQNKSTFHSHKIIENRSLIYPTYLAVVPGKIFWMPLGSGDVECQAPPPPGQTLKIGCELQGEAWQASLGQAGGRRLLGPLAPQISDSRVTRGARRASLDQFQTNELHSQHVCSRALSGALRAPQPLLREPAPCLRRGRAPPAWQPHFASMRASSAGSPPRMVAKAQPALASAAAAAAAGGATMFACRHACARSLSPCPVSL